MAPRKVVKENDLEEARPTRVLRPKQVAVDNYFNSIEEKDHKMKKTVKTKLVPKTKKIAEPIPLSKPKKVAAKGHKLPDPIKPGEIFIDSAKKSWKVGKSLGSGGFGEVYSATDNLNDDKADGYKYVMKVEYSTGPLFVEQNFYIRCAKAEHCKYDLLDIHLSQLSVIIKHHCLWGLDQEDLFKLVKTFMLHRY